MALEVNEQTFAKEVLESSKPVLVDFWAPWCGPCKMMSPVLEEIASEQTSVKICKVNVDDNPELAEKYGIMSIPNFILFKNGKVEKQQVGATSKDAMLGFING